MYFDSHAHLTDKTLVEDLQGILHRARQAGVSAVMNIATDEETLRSAIDFLQHPSSKQSVPQMVLAAATTPHDVANEGESFFPKVEQAIAQGHLRAVGETGLDYYYEHSPREIQQDFLRRYLALATSSRLPVIIHCRDAFEDLFRILDEEGYQGKGVLHCFTGTIPEAQEVLRRGWYLSLSGIVTYKKSEELREVAAIVPLDQLLIETDAPYLAPQSRRGKTNEPAYLPETAHCVAQVKGINEQAIAEATAANARRLFGV